MLSAAQAQAVYGHLHVIRKVVSRQDFLYRWGVRPLASKVQKELDAIKKLLEPEPVAVEKERDILRLWFDRKCEDLDAAGRQIGTLQVTVANLRRDLKCKNADLDATFRNNDTLRKKLATQHRQLAQAYNQVKGLQRTLELPLP